MTLTEQAVRDGLVNLWKKDLGETEDKGRNRSKMIDGINKEMGVPLGAPYCISGLLCRGVKVFCKLHGLKNPLPMTTSTQKFFDKTPEQYRVLPGKKARKGDIGILVVKTDSGHGHAYGLTADQPDTLTQNTVEYNTNKAGSRDGEGVHELVRTQNGTHSKRYRGAVDVAKWICAENNIK